MTLQALKKRADALAPGRDPVKYHYLSSTDFKDEKEREARRAELEKTPGHVVMLCDAVSTGRNAAGAIVPITIWNGDNDND